MGGVESLFAQATAPGINDPGLFLSGRKIQLSLKLKNSSGKETVFYVEQGLNSVLLTPTMGEGWTMVPYQEGDITYFTLRSISKGEYIMNDYKEVITTSSTVQDGYGFAMLRVPTNNQPLSIAILVN